MLTHLLTHSITHSLTYSLTCLLTHLLTYLLTYLLTHSLTYSLTHSLTHCVGDGADAALADRDLLPNEERRELLQQRELRPPEHPANYDHLLVVVRGIPEALGHRLDRTLTHSRTS